MIDLLLDGVRSIFALIDKMVAFVIEYLYQLIIAIADTNVFGDLIYQYFGRIYVFLGIFMVFKLSISMINYVINPDALTDKGKGVGKLVSNVVISLILLVVTPTLFDVAFDIQEDVLTTNAVYQIVTGKKAATGDSLYTSSKKMGKQLSFSVFSAFSYRSAKGPEGEDYEGHSPYCDPDEAGCDGKSNGHNVCDTGSKGNTDCLLDGVTVRNDDNVYWFLLSTAVGCVVAYILLTICFDIALRSVKLGFLQIVAPIPIMLRMDPGAKDDKFSKWLKEVGGTFLSLFIKLAALFFVIELIRLVMNEGEREALGMLQTYSGYEQSGLLGVFARLFIIIGCLMFAKKLPDLVSNLFGIKLDGGGFSLKKKLGDVPGMGLAKMAGAGALGFAGGMAANTLAARKNFSWDKNKGFWKNMGNNTLGLGKSFGSMAAGGVSAFGRGAFSKEKSLWKAAGAGVKGSVGARNLREDRIAAGDGGLKGYARRTGVGIANWAGIESGANKFDKQISSYDNFLKEQSSLYSYAESKVAEDAGFMVDNFTYTQADGTEFTWNGGALNLAQEQAALTRMEQDPTVDTATLVNQRSLVEAMKKKATTDYITANKDDGGAVQAALSNLEYMRSTDSAIKAEIGGPISDGGSVEAAKKSIKGAKSRTTSSTEYRQAQVNKKMDAKK